MSVQARADICALSEPEEAGELVVHPESTLVAGAGEVGVTAWASVPGDQVVEQRSPQRGRQNRHAVRGALAARVKAQRDGDAAAGHGSVALPGGLKTEYPPAPASGLAMRLSRDSVLCRAASGGGIACTSPSCSGP